MGHRVPCGLAQVEGQASIRDGAGSLKGSASCGTPFVLSLSKHGGRCLDEDAGLWFDKLTTNGNELTTDEGEPVKKR